MAFYICFYKHSNVSVYQNLLILDIEFFFNSILASTSVFKNENVGPKGLISNIYKKEILKIINFLYCWSNWTFLERIVKRIYNYNLTLMKINYSVDKTRWHNRAHQLHETLEYNARKYQLNFRCSLRCRTKRLYSRKRACADDDAIYVIH